MVLEVTKYFSIRCSHLEKSDPPRYSWNIVFTCHIKHKSWVTTLLDCFQIRKRIFRNDRNQKINHMETTKWKKYNITLGKVPTSNRGPSWPWSYASWIYNYLCNQCLSPLMLWIRITIRARCTTLCDKVCQWLSTGLWFSPGSPVSSTNKTDRRDSTRRKPKTCYES
jgi:hypothetical protein